VSPRPARSVAAGLLAALVVTTGAVAASASASPEPSPGVGQPDPALVDQALQAVAESDARLASATVSDAMRADATYALRPDDATFVLRPDDSTTVLEREREEKGDTVVTLTADLLFEFGEAALTPQATAAVTELAAQIPQDATVQVDGHTDSIGTDAKNLALSERRGQAVADVLADARPDLTLDVSGHGEADPVAANEVGGEDNPAGRALNRRVEVTYPTS
jgi:OOP family OmpA-OmpF porin